MKRNTFNSGNNQGFTLIEIMVGIFLLVVAMLGVISVTAVVIKSNQLSEMITTATTLAKDKIEQAKNDGYDGLTANAVEVDYANKASTVQATVASDSIYKRTLKVSADDTPVAATKTVEVKVQWPPPWPDSAHNVALRSVVAK